MVPRAQTVVNEGTVVIVVSTALVANGAVKGTIRFDYLTKHTQVVQVDIVLQKVVHQPYELVLGRQVARLHENWHKESHQGNAEKDTRDWDADLFGWRVFFDILETAHPEGRHYNGIEQQTHQHYK